MEHICQKSLPDAPWMSPATAQFVRPGRQCLLRLPVTGAIVISIHTHVIPRDRLSAETQAGLHNPEAVR